MDNFIPIEVKNERSLSKLGDITVFLTTELQKRLQKEKTKTGETLLDLFAKGMALRGFKHLIEKIRENDQNIKIVFTHNRNQKDDAQIFINYDDYRKSTSEKFFTFYREIGLDAASYFLNKNFPTHFSYDKNMISEAGIKKVSNNLEQIIEQASKKKKNKKAIIAQSSKIISELSIQKRLLKEEIKDLENLRESSNIFFFQNTIQELKTRLTKNYPETKGKNSWQTWIYDNNWLFGINYQPPIEKQKINIAGIMPDFLFPTLDNFMDILEIKLPSREIITLDPNHRGSYVWSSDTNKAIGQVVTYLSYSLHGIQVLSYTDLIRNGEEIVQNYTKKFSTLSTSHS